MSVRSLRYNTIEQHFGKGRMASTDRDALAFIEAAGIYNTNQQKAIVDLVRSLKRVGLWTKMKAIYPFIGGTATSHKWNLKDPRDADAAFRLTFSGGWTHSSTGAKPNGTNAFANTFLTPSSSLSLNSHSCGYYSNSNLSETASVDAVNMGSFNSATQALLVRKKTTTMDSRANAAFVSYTTNTMNGLFSVSKQSSTVTKIFIDATEVNSGNSGGTLPTVSIYLGDLNISGAGAYPDGYVLNDFRFAFVADGLANADVGSLSDLLTLYQKRLGRAV